MRKRILAAALLLAATGAFTAFATNVWALPTYTTPCNGCHSGAGATVATTLASTTGTSATYNVSAPGATAIAVFDGSTKLTTINASSGSFTVAFGKTYTIYAVTGPTTSSGIGTVSVTPVAPPADTTAPVTMSDAKATYVSSATIKLTATDNVGVTATYYTLDGGAQTAGTTISVTTVGSHTVSFWSVDAAGNIEVAKVVSFTVTAPAPVDTVAPVTTSDAKAIYVSSATIKLSATDNVGVAHTYYVLDGAPQVEGASLTVTAVGSHTLSFWSVDAAGNIEAANVVSFDVTAPAPVPDTTAPVTMSDAKATYVSSATIKLSATDNVGVAHTYYVLDGAPQVEGASLTVTAVGSHTLSFWSVDAAGNIEAANVVSFDVTAPAPVPVVTLTIAASVRRSHNVRTGRLSGLVAPATAAGRLSLYVRLPGSTRWVLVGHPVVSASGSWSYRYTMRRRGTYHFQVRFVTATGTIVSKTIAR